ncbi:hypothetical protein A1QO_10435 [Vibrio genomosp. F10 str. ZF-129]|uniref:O-antigen ligase-related domain-containing protein n=2 Tax=Vibrio genomosp. F10 TaxID=723171 RepID=A0A1E5BE87_9VIBR|nr:hypothetical protein A1QO_10435 [Vibrio genomosp. F10 str. ZF-129]OEE95590.1 hypothetical protein A1QM_04435 [Vibrio genomosp. F10 str. 9ZC157]
MLKSLSRHLLHLPLLWLAAGIIWFPQGNKPMVAIVLIVVLFYVFGHGLSDIKRNFQSSYWLGGILISALFVTISYKTYGASTQELRGLLIALVYLSVLPNNFLSWKNAQTLLCVAAMASFILSIWYFLIVPTDRIHWPTNPVPLAAHQGLVSLLSLGLLLTSFDGKKPWVLSFSMLLSGFSMLPTQSRGVIVGVAAVYFLACILLILQKKISYKNIVFSLVLMLICGALVKDVLMDRVNDTFEEVESIKSGNLDTSIGWRLQMYQAGIDLFVQKPILGHGEISSEYAEENAPGYTTSAYGYMAGHLHNNYIDKLAKSGFVGFSLLLFILFYPLYLGVFKYKNGFWLLALPSLHFIIFSMVDSPFRNGDTAVLYLIVIGLVIHSLSSVNQDKRLEP